MLLLSSPVTKTASAYDAWVTLTITEVPEGATGVIVENWCDGDAHEQTYQTKRGGLRHIGSGESSEHGYVTPTYHYLQWVKLNANRQCQAFVYYWEYPTDFKYRVIGYTTSAVNYLTTPVDITPTTVQTWADISLAAYVPSGTTWVIVRVVNEDANPRYCGLRKKGSTDDRHTWSNQPSDRIYYQFVGLNGSRIAQGWWQQTNVHLFLQAYGNEPIYADTNLAEISLSNTNTWEQKDITSLVPTNANLVLLQMYNSSSSPAKAWARKPGDTAITPDEAMLQPYTTLTVPAGLSTSKNVQIYRGSSSIKVYIAGSSGVGGTLYDETHKSLSLGSTITEDDAVRKIEIHRLVSFSTTLSESDTRLFKDLNRLISPTITLSELDSSLGGELNRLIDLSMSNEAWLGVKEDHRLISLSLSLSNYLLYSLYEQNLLIDAEMSLTYPIPVYTLSELSRLLELGAEIGYGINEQGKLFNMYFLLGSVGVYDETKYDESEYIYRLGDIQYCKELGRTMTILASTARAHSYDEIIKLLSLRQLFTVTDILIASGSVWNKILKDDGTWEIQPKDEPIH